MVDGGWKLRGQVGGMKIMTKGHQKKTLKCIKVVLHLCEILICTLPAEMARKASHGNKCL